MHDIPVMLDSYAIRGRGNYESLEGSYSYEFAYEFAYPIPPIGYLIGYEGDLIGYEIIYFNRKLDVLLDMEMTLPGFRREPKNLTHSNLPTPQVIINERSLMFRFVNPLIDTAHCLLH